MTSNFFILIFKKLKLISFYFICKWQQSFKQPHHATNQSLKGTVDVDETDLVKIQQYILLRNVKKRTEKKFRNQKRKCRAFYFYE